MFALHASLAVSDSETAALQLEILKFRSCNIIVVQNNIFFSYVEIFVSKILSQDSLLDNRDPHSRGEEREKEEEENIVSSDGGHVVPLSLLHRY